MRAVALLALLFVVTSTWDGKRASSDETLIPLTVEALMDDDLSIEAIDAGATGAVAEERREVISNAEMLEMRWSTLYSHRRELPAVPVVDFEERVVVFASLGQRPTGGYRVELARAVHDEDRGVVELTVREVTPGPSCMVQQVLTFPYLWAAVEAVDASYVFVEGAPRVAAC